MSTVRRLCVSFGIAVAAIATGTAAVAYWATTGAGSATALVATLAAPTSVSASPSGSTVDVAWTGPGGPGGGSVDGYYLQRSTGAPGGTCASSPTSLLPAASTSCADTGVAAGSYAYTVVAVFRSWTSSASSAPATVSATLHHFSVQGPASATAGAAFNVTVTAQDASNATMTTYSGSQSLSWTGPGSAPNGSTPTYPSSVSFTNGVGTASVTLVKGETVALTATQVTSSVTGVSSDIVVSAGVATQFLVASGTPQTAGTPFNVTLTAQDAYRNTAVSYSGSKTIVWSGPANAPRGTSPTYPGSVTFSSGGGGAPVTLVKAETAVLTATEGAVTGSSGAIEVGAGTAANLAWTSVTTTAGTVVPPCLFACTVNNINTNKEFTARVSVTDATGNTVSALGAGHTVRVTTPTADAGSGGAFTSPTAGSSVDLTIAPTGAAASTATFTFKTQTGTWTFDTFSATTLAGATYTSATARVNR